MKVWTDWGRLGDRLGLGVSIAWEDWHLKQIEFSLDFGIWYFSLYIQFKGGEPCRRKAR